MNFDTKVDIVAECWMVTRNVEAWKELLTYGDIGFPLAYAYKTDLVELKSDKAKVYIEELYEIIAKTLDIDVDAEYNDFEDMLDANIEKFKGKDVDN